MGKQETMQKLRTLLADLYDARYKGDRATRILEAQGLADGYMRALRDLDVVNDAELLAFAANEQRAAAARADQD